MKRRKQPRIITLKWTKSSDSLRSVVKSVNRTKKRCISYTISTKFGVKALSLKIFSLSPDEQGHEKKRLDSGIVRIGFGINVPFSVSTLTQEKAFRSH